MEYLRLYKYGYWKDEQQPYQYGIHGINPRPTLENVRFIGTAFSCMVDGEHWFHGFGPDECKEDPNFTNDSNHQIMSRNVVKTRIDNRWLLEYECFLRPHHLSHTTWRSCKVETVNRALSGTHKLLCPPSEAEPKEYRGWFIDPGVDVYCDSKPIRTGGTHDLVYTPTQSLHGVWYDTSNAHSIVSQTVAIDRFRCLDFVADSAQ